jgi:hypothetical protein
MSVLLLMRLGRFWNNNSNEIFSDLYGGDVDVGLPDEKFEFNKIVFRPVPDEINRGNRE